MKQLLQLKLHLWDWNASNAITNPTSNFDFTFSHTLRIKPKFIMRIKLSAYGELGYLWEADVKENG